MTKNETRRTILDTAESLFIEKGITRTQMKEVAEKCGISRRTLYRYFPTKDELAFSIEIVIVQQMNEFFSRVNFKEIQSGIGKIDRYFQIDLKDVRDQLRYTAQFDQYFQLDYPTDELSKTFKEMLNPEKDFLYGFVKEGQADGTIRNDLSALELYQFISQTSIALFQRLVLREKHLDDEYCRGVDFQKLYRDIVLNGISPISCN